MPIALLFGATGLVGRHTLTRPARRTRVMTLDRRPIAPVSATHAQTVVDFDSLDPDVRQPVLRTRDDDAYAKAAGAKKGALT